VQRLVVEGFMDDGIDQAFVVVHQVVEDNRSPALWLDL
jgi:hypothetical protein